MNLATWFGQNWKAVGTYGLGTVLSLGLVIFLGRAFERQFELLQKNNETAVQNAVANEKIADALDKIGDETDDVGDALREKVGPAVDRNTEFMVRLEASTRDLHKSIWGEVRKGNLKPTAALPAEIGD